MDLLNSLKAWFLKCLSIQFFIDSTLKLFLNIHGLQDKTIANFQKQLFNSIQRLSVKTFSSKYKTQCYSSPFSKRMMILTWKNTNKSLLILRIILINGTTQFRKRNDRCLKMMMNSYILIIAHHDSHKILKIPK